jgi:DNA-binding HxlR family transcriptional regulator
MAKLRKVADICPLEIGMNRISGRWKLPILWHLSHGTIRFNELQRRMGRITQLSLTRQLRELERDGLVSRKAYPEVPPKVEYALSELGRSFLPVLDALCVWGRKVRDGRPGSALNGRASE